MYINSLLGQIQQIVENVFINDHRTGPAAELAIKFSKFDRTEPYYGTSTFGPHIFTDRYKSQT